MPVRGVHATRRTCSLDADARIASPEDRPLFERFTDRARKVMALANQEAHRLNHEFIGTEHILLGLIKEGRGVGANALMNLGVDIRAACDEVEKLIRSGPGTRDTGRLPQTPRAKKVVEYALLEARDLGHNYVGTEHLLLGLLKEQEGVAAQVLMNLGIAQERVRAEVLRLLDTGAASPTSPDAPGPVTQAEAVARRDYYTSPSRRPASPPRWLAVTSVVFGFLLIVAGYYLSAWILNLNAFRAVAETMAASMAKNDAAYRAGRPRQPRIDPLNPATWSVESSVDKDSTEQERLRARRIIREIGVVEVATKVWKLATWCVGGLVAALGVVAWRTERRRGLLFVVIALLGLLATAMATAGMRVLIAHGGFQPRPIGDYVTVLAAGSAYPWLMLAFLAGFRYGRGPTTSTARDDAAS